MSVPKNEILRLVYKHTRESEAFKILHVIAMASTRPKIPAGLELAFDLEKGNVRSPLDAFVLSLHWSVVRTGLKQRSRGQGQELTERLPADWSSQQGQQQGQSRTFSLFYFDPQNARVRYELRVIELTSNDMVAVTFFRSPNPGGDEAGSSGGSGAGAAGSGNPNRAASTVTSGSEANSAAATFQIGSFVRLASFQQGAGRERAADVYENADRLETQFYEGVMEPLGLRVMGRPPVPGPYDDKSKAQGQGTSEGQRQPLNPIREPYSEDRFVPDFGRRPSPLGPGMPLGPLHVPPLGGMGGLGRSDLDPLGRIGMGNILDPRGLRGPGGGLGGLGGIGPMPGVPRGGLPPGARFDPFGPPNPVRPDGGAGAFSTPNPDHERPPNDYDDMFM